MSIERLKRTLEDAPVIKKGDYHYVVHPITDGLPSVDPELLEEVICEMLKVGEFDCDRIVTAEAMGVPLATALSLRTGIPFTIIRKRSYGLEGEVKVAQVTGYSKANLYINGLVEGDRIVLVDDILSTGGTLRAILHALQHIGVSVTEVIVAVEKSFGACEYGRSHREELQREFGVPVKTLCTF